MESKSGRGRHSEDGSSSASPPLSAWKLFLRCRVGHDPAHESEVDMGDPAGCNPRVLHDCRLAGHLLRHVPPRPTTQPVCERGGRVRPEPPPGDYIPEIDPSSVRDHEESSSVRQIHQFATAGFDVVVTRGPTELPSPRETKRMYGESWAYALSAQRSPYVRSGSKVLRQCRTHLTDRYVARVKDPPLMDGAGNASERVVCRND